MRRKLIPSHLLPLLAGLTIAVAGCSSSAPLPSSSSVGASSAPTGPTKSVSASLSGLTAACSAVIDGQAAVAALFAEPVDGRQLSKTEVAKVFGSIGPDIPSPLREDIATLRDAADRAVGKSDVDVASILAEQKVAGAMAEVSDYVKGCTPKTS